MWKLTALFLIVFLAVSMGRAGICPAAVVGDHFQSERPAANISGTDSATLQEVCEEIHKKTGYLITSNRSWPDIKISLSHRSYSIRECLIKALRKSGIDCYALTFCDARKTVEVYLPYPTDKMEKSILGNNYSQVWGIGGYDESVNYGQLASPSADSLVKATSGATDQPPPPDENWMTAESAMSEATPPLDDNITEEMRPSNEEPQPPDYNITDEMRAANEDPPPPDDKPRDDEWGGKNEAPPPPPDKNLLLE